MHGQTQPMHGCALCQPCKCSPLLGAEAWELPPPCTQQASALGVNVISATSGACHGHPCLISCSSWQMQKGPHAQHASKLPESSMNTQMWACGELTASVQSWPKCS